MDNHALRLLKENYCRRNKRYYVVQFPYCNDDDIPAEARLFRRFDMPQELDKLIRNIYGVDRVRFFGVNKRQFEESIESAINEIKGDKLKETTPNIIDQTGKIIFYTKYEIWRIYILKKTANSWGLALYFLITCIGKLSGKKWGKTALITNLNSKLVSACVQILNFDFWFWILILNSEFWFWISNFKFYVLNFYLLILMLDLKLWILVSDFDFYFFDFEDCVRSDSRFRYLPPGATRHC